MESFKKYKKILTGVAIVIVLFVVYSMFKGDPAPDALLTAETPSGLPPEEEDLVSLLLELQSIDLNSDIFSDAVFVTLQDFSVKLTPQPIGRRNPFAPIGVGAEPRTTTAATASPQTAEDIL